MAFDSPSLSRPEPIITLRGVSKTYVIWDNPSARLYVMLRRMAGGAGAKNAGHRFTAVHEVDLEIAPGECLGIIGRNGAGKSTLLQMIAGTLRPTTGEIIVRGRVAALLELGSGFNPDFTGRENIHLNAAILGLSKPEIAAKFDSIVAYSGIEEFIDQPVRTYSSGMTLRLAFAVCVHVDADILIIDEALAVGDARFQFKCHATLDQLLKEGRTIIFVSHDTNSVKRMCRTALLLERGEVLLQGSPNDVTNIYTKLITSPHGVEAIRADIAALRTVAVPLLRSAERTGFVPAVARRSGQPGVCPDQSPGKGSSVAKAMDDMAGPLFAATNPVFVPGSHQGEIEAKEPAVALRAVARQATAPISTLDPHLSTSSASLDDSITAPPTPGMKLLKEERSHQQISDKEYAYGGESGQITAVQLTDAQDQPRLSFLTGSMIRVRFTCQATTDISDPIYALTLKDVRGQEIYGTNTYFENQAPPDVPAGGPAEAVFDLQLNVLPGVYFISLGWVRLVNCEVQVIHRRYDVLRFDVLPRDKSFGIAYCPTQITVRGVTR